MEDLSNILVKLSQHILKVNQSRKLKISKLLLNSLDPLYFTQGSLLSISTFSELNFEIVNYYKDKFNEQIKPQFFYEVQLDDKFFAIFKLIMDIALSTQRKQQFLNAILDMTQNEKNLLMDFVAQVVKRQQYIDFASKQNAQKLAYAQNILMQQKFQQLKQQYKQFQKIYYQLFDQHQSLKKNHYKINKQLIHLKQLQFQLLDDLGLHHNAGFIDITQKYRKDVQDFAQDSARMHRQLQQKSQLIKRKQKQNHELILNFAAKQQSLSQTYQQKMTQLMKKQILVQKKLQQSSQKQQQYRFQILRLKDIIIDIRKQLQQKNHKLFEQQSIIDKFNKMRKLHLEFRKVMVENYRNGMTHLNNTTQSSNNININNNNNTYASTSTGGVNS